MQEELTELQHDGFARDVYSEKYLRDFWFTMCKSYKRIAEPAIQALLFVSSSAIQAPAIQALLSFNMVV